jgi:multidrug efflux system membrane fusion protein
LTVLLGATLLAGAALSVACHGKSSSDRQGDAGLPSIPVVVAIIKRNNLPLYLVGLGTVTPLVTVTVRSRVDGQLMRVLFEEGQHVKKGELLAEIDRRPFDAQLLQAQGQMIRDRALLENARHDLARYALLATQDSIARQQYDTQKSLVSQLEGTVATDQAQIDTARLQIVYSRITATETGRVGLRLVDPGNIVHATDTTGIVTIAQDRPISVVFPIAQDNLQPVFQRLRAGEHLIVDAFDRLLARKLASGTLLTIDNEIDPTTGTVKLKAIFDNQHDELFPQQFVNAKLLLDVLRDAIVAPVAAVQHGAQRTFVYVVRVDDTVEVRDVKLGPTQEDEVAVVSGLAAGDRVVVDGADRLREGMHVTFRPESDAGVGGGPR